MYVVACSDRSFYCGATTDLDRRVDEHNTKKKGAKYTRSRRPVTLFFYEEHPDRSSALKSEASFKKLTRRQKLKYMADECDRRLAADYKSYLDSLEIDIVGNNSVGEHDPKVSTDKDCTAESGK